MIVIGLTGGILSGKSTVSGMLAERGAVIIDADKVGHQAYQPHTDVWQELVDTFGEWILKQNGEIDRKRLGEIVFHDPSALILLNKIVHPRMREIIEEELKRLRAEGASVVVIEAADMGYHRSRGKGNRPSAEPRRAERGTGAGAYRCPTPPGRQG
jgi:dephospho-CoA kinase